MCAWEPASLQRLLLWIVWLLILASCCVQAFKMIRNSCLYFEDSIAKMCESDPLSDKSIYHDAWSLRPSPLSYYLLFRVTYESAGTTTCFFLSDVVTPCHRLWGRRRIKHNKRPYGRDKYSSLTYLAQPFPKRTGICNLITKSKIILQNNKWERLKYVIIIKRLESGLKMIPKSYLRSPCHYP